MYKLKKYKYGDGCSGKILTSFLTSKLPFKKYFDQKKAAESFYKNVRCGLLHEAMTCENWIIKARHESKIYEEKNGKQIIYRDNFLAGVNVYLAFYKIELLESKDRKDAFIRKMDGICQLTE